MAGALQGHHARIEWVYYSAAQLEGFSLVKINGGAPGQPYAVTGTVVLEDAYKLTKRPLRFVVPHKRGVWEWPIVRFTITRGRLEAVLGPALPAGRASSIEGINIYAESVCPTGDRAIAARG